MLSQSHFPLLSDTYYRSETFILYLVFPDRLIDDVRCLIDSLKPFLLLLLLKYVADLQHFRYTAK